MLTLNEKDKEKRPLTDIVREVTRNQRRDFQEWKVDPIEQMWQSYGKKKNNNNVKTEKYIEFEQCPPFWMYKMHVSLRKKYVNI